MTKSCSRQTIYAWPPRSIEQTRPFRRDRWRRALNAVTLLALAAFLAACLFGCTTGASPYAAEAEAVSGHVSGYVGAVGELLDNEVLRESEDAREALKVRGEAVASEVEALSEALNDRDPDPEDDGVEEQDEAEDEAEADEQPEGE